ncbi:MAG TPA: class I SAM-dependent methyltransferase [Bryobacteraceae bacterium]|nr:class I SAM-dependent methyltransferase [Bryobacteraceae bacterium]
MISFPGSNVGRWVTRCAIALVAIIVVIGVAGFPYDVDRPLTAAELEKNRKYYAEAYRNGTPSREQPLSAYDTKYIEIATRAAEDFRINDHVADFASKYDLRNGRVLDIGSGRGYLQDVVVNYTGLDISSNVGRFYHKKFVLGSATAMPFPDSSFDGAWSIWVLEHIPNPEQALAETRRVLKNKAVFLLEPAWNCTPWAADGYDVRPYSAFDWRGKLIKASIPMRDSKLFRAAARLPERTLRNVASRFGPTRLHYRLLQPNYKDYWQADSDALNGIDRYEVMLWFRSRGDECLNCEGLSGTELMRWSPSLIIRIHK